MWTSRFVSYSVLAVLSISNSLRLKIIGFNGAVFFYSDRTPVGVEIRGIEGAVFYGDRGSIGIKRWSAQRVPADYDFRTFFSSKSGKIGIYVRNEFSCRGKNQFRSSDAAGIYQAPTDSDSRIALNRASVVKRIFFIEERSPVFEWKGSCVICSLCRIIRIDGNNSVVVYFLSLEIVAEREPSVKVFTEASGLEKSLKRTCLCWLLKTLLSENRYEDPRHPICWQNWNQHS